MTTTSRRLTAVVFTDIVGYSAVDTNVPMQQSAEVLRKLGKANIEVKIALESPPGRGNSIFRDDALRDIRDFIRVQTARQTTITLRARRK